MFYRHPNRKEFCEASEEAKKNNKKLEMDGYVMMESPGRKKLRDAAAISMMSNGRNMKMNASKIDGEIEVGSIVWSSLSDVDCTKVDGKCLTLVVVDKISEKGKSIPKYRLACAKGPLQGLYHRSYLTVIPMATRGTLGLEDIFISWRGVAAITERAAAASTSVIGGQGVNRCNCRGECNTKRCMCFKGGKLCGSQCHGGDNSKCQNCG